METNDTVISIVREYRLFVCFELSIGHGDVVFTDLFQASPDVGFETGTIDYWLLIRYRNFVVWPLIWHCNFIVENGFYAAIPFVTFLISKNAMAPLFDWLKQRGLLSPTVSCKVSQFLCEKKLRWFDCLLASFGSAICLLALALFVDCRRTEVALVILIVYCKV